MISRFADSAGCRHRQICLHFGETPKWDRCGTCDNCSVKPDWLCGKLPAGIGAPAPRRKKAVVLVPADDFLPTADIRREVDPELAEYLREWRRNIARENKIAAFVVMHDSTLEELCRRRPATIAQLLQVSGIGERKADLYGADILQAMRNFANGARAAAPSGRQTSPAELTLRLLKEGRTFGEIAQIRALQPSTVAGTVATLIETGRVKLDPKWISPDALPLIEAACLEKGVERFRMIKDALPPFVSYDDIRLVVASLRADGRLREKSA